MTKRHNRSNGWKVRTIDYHNLSKQNYFRNLNSSNHLRQSSHSLDNIKKFREELNRNRLEITEDLSVLILTLSATTYGATLVVDSIRNEDPLGFSVGTFVYLMGAYLTEKSSHNVRNNPVARFY